MFESGGFDYMKPLRIGLLIPQTYEQNEKEKRKTSIKVEIELR